MKKRVLKVVSIIIGALLLIPIGFILFLYISGNSVGRYKEEFNREDFSNGPHVFFQQDSTFKCSYLIQDEVLEFKDSTFFFQHLPQRLTVSKKGNMPIQFDIELSPIKSENKNVFKEVERFAVISDFEGSFHVFKNMLLKAKVINENQEWSYGESHLVLVGDFMDRGYFVTELLWFIYKLEQEAEKSGGKVHFVLGNHEVMNMYGDYRYTRGTYFMTAKTFGMKHHELYDENSFIGRWLRTKPILLKLNDNLFCHGGISPLLLKEKQSIDLINIKARNAVDKHRLDPSLDMFQKILVGKYGPLWYRGFFDGYGYQQCSQNHIDSICQFYDVNRVIVGHTTQEKIASRFNGKVIGVDLHTPRDHKNYFPQRHAGMLLYEGNKFYVLTDTGEKDALQPH